MECRLNIALMCIFLRLLLKGMDIYIYKHKNICINGYINIHLNDFRCLCMSVCVNIYVHTNIQGAHECRYCTERCVCSLAGVFVSKSV